VREERTKLEFVTLLCKASSSPNPMTTTKSVRTTVAGAAMATVDCVRRKIGILLTTMSTGKAAVAAAPTVFSVSVRPPAAAAATTTTCRGHDEDYRVWSGSTSTRRLTDGVSSNGASLTSDIFNGHGVLNGNNRLRNACTFGSTGDLHLPLIRTFCPAEKKVEIDEEDQTQGKERKKKKTFLYFPSGRRRRLQRQ
jgi:hypothetical protein